MGRHTVVHMATCMHRAEWSSQGRSVADISRRLQPVSDSSDSDPRRLRRPLEVSSSSSSIYLDKTKHKCQGHVGTYRHHSNIHDRVVIAVQ